MREAKAFTIADALTKYLTTWYLGKTAIIRTAEETPPEIGETFRLGLKDYTVVVVMGEHSPRWVNAVIVTKEAEPCA